MREIAMGTGNSMKDSCSENGENKLSYFQWGKNQVDDVGGNRKGFLA